MPHVVWRTWLVLFSADALILAIGGRSAVSTATLGLLAVGVPVMLLLTIATPRVPAWIVAPTATVVGWRLLGAMPLPLWTWGSPWAWRLEAIVALSVVAGITVVLWRRGIPPDAAGSWRRSLALLGGGLVVGPIVLGTYLWGSAAAGLHALTEGYVGLDRHGLYLTQRAFTRGDATVHLIGMVHIGEADRYADLYRSLCDLRDGVILAETSPGSDPEASSYGGLASSLGLVSQPPMTDCGLPILAADTFAERMSDQTYRQVDASLDALDALQQSDRPWVDLLATMQRPGAGDPVAFQALWGDLVEVRNAGLRSTLEEAIADHDQIVVPWGGAHLPSFEDTLIADGWIRSEGETRWPLISYRSRSP